jgi:hypothetical protein
MLSKLSPFDLHLDLLWVCLVLHVRVMGVQCTSTMRYFLHTFLFATNQSTFDPAVINGQHGGGAYVGDRTPGGLDGGWLLQDVDGLTNLGNGTLLLARRTGDLQQALECMQVGLL